MRPPGASRAITLRVTKVPDLYNQIVRTYRTLVQLKPKVRLGIRRLLSDN